jgi:deoxycytidine triphosphate deaminase
MEREEWHKVGQYCSRRQVESIIEYKYDLILTEQRIIWIGPGETILGHTNEFVGGKISVTAMMKARSSLGRNFIEVINSAFVLI